MNPEVNREYPEPDEADLIEEMVAVAVELNGRRMDTCAEANMPRVRNERMVRKVEVRMINGWCWVRSGHVGSSPAPGAVSGLRSGRS